MKPPKFAIGQSVYAFSSLFTVRSVLDRYWDDHEQVWRYRIDKHVRWISEELLKTEEEMQEVLGDAAIEDDEDEDFTDYEYDGDTGRALINGQWRVMDSDQWDRFQKS